MNEPEDAIEIARRAGIDLSLIDSSLALSYEERALRHASALELLQAMKQAGIAHEHASRPAAETR